MLQRLQRVQFGYSGPQWDAGEWALPVSATYVIDRDGSIIYAYRDADYRDRADPRDVLQVLTKRAVAA